MGDPHDRHRFRLQGDSAELAVFSLAQHSFLTDWCYLRPRLPGGNELCDLLVVFDDVAIIWQIKDVKLRADGTYRPRDVARNLRQVIGARRQLIDLATPITLENPRRGREQFDRAEIREVFLIAAFVGPSAPETPVLESVGGHLVHRFSRSFVEIALSELDTVADFVEYLRAKEQALAEDAARSGVSDEADLLATYLSNRHTFPSEGVVTGTISGPGAWSELMRSDEYRRKCEADEVSYCWDHMINCAHKGSAEYERIARELARPSRLERRGLAEGFLAVVIRAHEDPVHDIARRVLIGERQTFCFVFLDDEEPHLTRRRSLGALCLVARVRCPQHRKVVGVATAKTLRPTCSYDFCVVDLPEITPELQAEVEELQREAQILVAPEMTGVRHHEYPPIEATDDDIGDSTAREGVVPPSKPPDQEPS